LESDWSGRETESFDAGATRGKKNNREVAEMNFLENHNQTTTTGDWPA
jgi:hypothetical protein